jgi:hypothetical protein
MSIKYDNYDLCLCLEHTYYEWEKKANKCMQCEKPLYEDESSKTLKLVIADLRQREEKGIQTYGGTVDEANLSKQEWLQHAYEEALDLCIYLKKLMA